MSLLEILQVYSYGRRMFDPYTPELVAPRLSRLIADRWDYLQILAARKKILNVDTLAVLKQVGVAVLSPHDDQLVESTTQAQSICINSIRSPQCTFTFLNLVELTLNTWTWSKIHLDRIDAPGLRP
ncbi:hypothetical protein M422DRAFT_242924 [Sphaerobolus stellatus SS14]|nr:hypothetical protein M422DRAFT_242924 [Sphaerobolus stellatus SS14]